MLVACVGHKTRMNEHQPAYPQLFWTQNYGGLSADGRKIQSGWIIMYMLGRLRINEHQRLIHNNMKIKEGREGKHECKIRNRRVNLIGREKSKVMKFQQHYDDDFKYKRKRGVMLEGSK